METIVLELKNQEDLQFIERIAKSIGAKIIKKEVAQLNEMTVEEEKGVYLSESKRRMSHIIEKHL